jgi:hypothetical protein
MNVQEAIKRLETFGIKVYARENKWSVWYPTCKNNDARDYYSDRELIRLAKNSIFHKNWRAAGKYKVGPGGAACSCCTRSPLNELKVQYRRQNRRKNKQDISKNVE